MNKEAYLKRMAYLQKEKTEIIKTALEEYDCITRAYPNQIIGVEEAEYFLSAISGAKVYNYMDPLYIKLLANTYKCTNKKEAYRERRFLLSEAVLMEGSIYAQMVIEMGQDKSSLEKSMIYYISSEQEFIATYKDSLQNQQAVFEQTEFVRPYQKKRSSST